MIKDKIFECFDEYVEKRYYTMGDYKKPELNDIIDSADDILMERYRVVETITNSDVAEKESERFEKEMYRDYMENRHNEKVREIRENIVDRRERYRTEQSLKAGKI